METAERYVQQGPLFAGVVFRADKEGQAELLAKYHRLLARYPEVPYTDYRIIVGTNPFSGVVEMALDCRDPRVFGWHVSDDD